ncbi:MAG: hypothetical protein WCG27_06040, partial [Pseudomonadota bacterium]
YKAYLGDGLFVPAITSKKLDEDAVRKFIPELQEKKKWIEKNIEILKGHKTFQDLRKNIQEINGLIPGLLNFQKEFQDNKNQEQKEKIRHLSSEKMAELRTKVDKLVEIIPFWTSFQYPVDHFKLRQDYDRYKDSIDPEGRAKANRIYLQRRLVQDGAPGTTWGINNDLWFRSLLDTFVLELKQKKDFLSESLRYDWWSLAHQLQQKSKERPASQIKLMQEWVQSVDKAMRFYQDILYDRVVDGKSFLTSLQWVEMKTKSRLTLESWVEEKQRLTINFWKKQSELMQALYVIQTILFNEVGRQDGPDTDERQDVTQVIINRTMADEYHQSKETIDGPWPDVLFKKGEFSFTYFFIPATVRVFCPDMSRRGKSLMRENLKVGLELLQNPHWNFTAIRYFSRASMLGRIDMGKLWDEYEPLAERAGELVIIGKKKLKKKYAQGKYQFLYYFTDPENKKFQVVEMEKRVFVIPMDGNNIYRWRNPHLFRYFAIARSAK